MGDILILTTFGACSVCWALAFLAALINPTNYLPSRAEFFLGAQFWLIGQVVLSWGAAELLAYVGGF